MARKLRKTAGGHAFAADGLKSDIQRRVATGELPVGARIPPARQLARDYSLSYATCHKALAELETDGLLVRQQGRGSFVADASATGTVSLKVKVLDLERKRGLGAIDDFARERRRLTVTVAGPGHDEGDGEPDILQMVSWEATMRADELVGLDGFASEILASGELDPVGVDVFRVGGELKALPGYFAPLVFFGNRRLLERAGVELPSKWTFGEMLETAGRVQSALGSAASALLFPRLYFLMPVFWSHGVEPGGTPRWGLDSRKAPRALEAIREWRRAASLEMGANGVKQLAKLIVAGKLALAPWSGSIVPELLSELGDDLVVAPYPTGPAGSATVMTAEGIGISIGCRHPELAWELVSSLAEADAGDVAGAGTRIACRRSLRVGDRIDDAFEAAAGSARVVTAACDRELFGLMDRMLAEFVVSDEPAADFAVRAGSVAEALAAARRGDRVNGGEVVG